MSSHTGLLLILELFCPKKNINKQNKTERDRQTNAQNGNPKKNTQKKLIAFGGENVLYSEMREYTMIRSRKLKPAIIPGSSISPEAKYSPASRPLMQCRK